MTSNCYVQIRILAFFSAILCMCCVCIITMDDGLDAAPYDDPYGGGGAFEDVTGSGTESDPLVFSEQDLVTTATDLMNFLRDYLQSGGYGDDVYIQFPSGSTVNIYEPVVGFYDEYYSIHCVEEGSLTYNPGDSDYMGQISGIATLNFTIHVDHTSQGSIVGFVDDRYLHFIAVGTEPITFLSDPTTDGIIIPPNHHLVRFIGSDGVQIGYDIVEHGGFMQLPDGHESDLWSESADLSSGFFETSQPIQSDMSLYAYSGPTVGVDSDSLTLWTNASPSSGHIGVTAVGGVVWTVSNSAPDVVSIETDDDGFTVSAVSAGDATVTIIPSFGEAVTVDVSVSTASSSTRFQVHVVEYDHGTTTVNPTMAQHGQMVTISATPYDSAVKRVKVVDADGNQIQVDELDSKTYTFQMPRSDVYVHVEYSADHSGGTN